jgi:hypothetical protein
MPDALTFDLCPEARPTRDFAVANHSTVWTFKPLTLAASDWWSDHVQNGPGIGGAFAVEHRFADGILSAITEEGFRV